MPDFVEGLRDIKEGRGAVGLVFEGFIDPVDDMSLIRVLPGLHFLKTIM
jgi:hypothetical protein